MNFKRNESATKLRGGYYTPPSIARFLIRWVQEIEPQRLLEPSCGDGVFFRCLAEWTEQVPRTVVGFEIDPAEAEEARKAGEDLAKSDFTVHNGEFLGWAVKSFMSGEKFDAVVGNPPFIRYQYCDPELQARSEAIFQYFGLRFTRHTNAWVPFVIASIALLRPGGRLAMVIPAEILHVLHAQSLRTFLSRECSRVLIFDPEELWFEDVLQGAVLLLAEKNGNRSEPSKGIAIVPTRSDAFLRADPSHFFASVTYTNGPTIEGKWMLALLTPEERAVLQHVEATGRVRRFVAVADVDVGIVTGANKFFLVPDEVVDDYDLHRWAYPMFGRSEHVPGVIYDEGTHQTNREAGLPANFIWFKPDERMDDLPPRVRAYLREGLRQELHKRYKCRVRAPWFSVPSVYATPVAMLKRSHSYPRLILNRATAFTTDTAYRVKPKGVSPTHLVYSFVNSLTALSAEIEGRHYGGGVLELVPSEIERLLVPVVKATLKDLARLDRAVRSDTQPEDVLRAQDEIVLRAAGFGAAEREALHEAWLRLKRRRQRIIVQG